MEMKRLCEIVGTFAIVSSAAAGCGSSEESPATPSTADAGRDAAQTTETGDSAPATPAFKSDPPGAANVNADP
jgi:hypothetical protein